MNETKTARMSGENNGYSRFQYPTRLCTGSKTARRYRASPSITDGVQQIECSCVRRSCEITKNRSRRTVRHTRIVKRIVRRLPRTAI